MGSEYSARVKSTEVRVKILKILVRRLGIEPTTIGLKVRNRLNKRLIIQPLTGTPVATYAQLCTTVHN